MSKILFLILLIAGLIVGVYLVGKQTGFFSKADISTAPQEIQVSNIADNAFSVSWITAKPTTGFVQYGENETLGEVSSDDRDTDGPKPRLTHHVTLKNLNPSTVYFYKVNNGNIAKQITAPVTGNPPAVPEPIFGKITQSDGSMPAEALIFLQIGDGSLLSGYIRDQGNWLITLNNARTKDLSNYIAISGDDTANVLVRSGENKAEAQSKLNDKGAFSKIALPNTTDASTSDVKDLNGDGVVNTIDRILLFTKKR